MTYRTPQPKRPPRAERGVAVAQKITLGLDKLLNENVKAVIPTRDIWPQHLRFDPIEDEADELTIESDTETQFYTLIDMDTGDVLGTEGMHPPSALQPAKWVPAYQINGRAAYDQAVQLSFSEAVDVLFQRSDFKPLSACVAQRRDVQIMRIDVTYAPDRIHLDTETRAIAALERVKNLLSKEDFEVMVSAIRSK
jgi:hypothetical protein